MTLETLVNWALIVGGLATVILALVAIIFGWVAKRRDALASYEGQWSAHAARAQFRIRAAILSGTSITYLLFVDLVAPVPPSGHPLEVGRVAKGFHRYNVTVTLLDDDLVKNTSGLTIVDPDITEAIRNARAQVGLPALSPTDEVETLGDTFAFVRDEHSIVWAHRID